MKSSHSGRLERWAGAERLDEISKKMRGWHGPPIHLLDIPGSVRVCADGDFIGPFERGYFASAADALADHWKQLGRMSHGTLHTGFSGIADALSREKTGYAQTLRFQKPNIATPAIGSVMSWWAVAGVPAAGSAGAAAPGGTAHVSTDAGSMLFNNPNTGTTHLVGADDFGQTGASTAASVLLYDRLFSVAKTMSSSATEAVTGVPTRYQSTTASNADYIGGNFGFIEASSALNATAHNWTVCKYTDESGSTQTMPSIGGVLSCVANRFDMTAGNWFLPLASNNIGIGAWTQMQCDSAALTGGINFCIGRPIGWMLFTNNALGFPYDWLTNRQLAPRVFDSAALAILNYSNGASSCVPSGTITLVNAP